MLKPVVTDINEVEEPYRKLYIQKDGKWHLEVEGMAPKERVDEFRNNNIRLDNEIKKLKEDLARFEGIDPEKVKETEHKIKKAEEDKLIAKGEHERVFNERIAILKKEHEGQLKAKDAKISELEGTLTKTQKDRDHYIITRELASALEKEFQPGSSKVLEPHALSQFTVKDGKVIALNADGTTRYGKDAVTPLSLRDWAVDYAEQNGTKWMIRGSSGSGSGNGERVPGGVGEIVLNDAQSKDPRAYRQAKAQAEKNGGEVILG